MTSTSGTVCTGYTATLNVFGLRGAKITRAIKIVCAIILNERIESILKILLFNMFKIIIFWISKIKKSKLFHFSFMTLLQRLIDYHYLPRLFNLMALLFLICWRRFMTDTIQMLNGHFSSDKESKIEQMAMSYRTLTGQIWEMPLKILDNSLDRFGCNNQYHS